MDAPDIEISAELTPNPNTLKFIVNRALVEAGTRNFPTLESSQGSALPSKLFENEAVAGVMIGQDFVTVTKKPELEWPSIAAGIVETIRTFLSTGEAPVGALAETSGGGHVVTEIEQKIIDILNEEIRPAVARDGGDIVFYGYEDGIVKLHLQGSCSSCPSSIMTLKMGIESRLRQALPEIKEVQQV